ncbi:MAG: hypothetical protein BJ554DRAFT_1647 [Olpidium bornovanus]|uniref:Uncharacterized protein n=1 Tax=Olpidium bornovanus TaxID=278681 RepID=A0A8H8DHB4_9FUNG|nr:MAG: hypothetical protein BJ554DRAFT_1647 [Olpidium bornovanus]
MINRRQEEEMLGQIVHRMSENLIDISSTNVAERLQQQGHVYRSVEYREVLSSIVLPDDLMASLDEIPRKSSRWFEIPPEKDKEVGPDWSQEDADRMTAARAEIKQAVDDMQLKDPGDLVVSLTSEA